MTNSTVGILEQYKKLIIKTKPLDHKLLQDIYEAIGREFERPEENSIISALKHNIEEKDRVIQKMVNNFIDDHQAVNAHMKPRKVGE